MFKGSFVALVTPFTQEKEVDYDKLAELIEWHIQEGTDGIVCCGTTGESPTLNHEEQLLIFKKAVEVSAKRIPIIAGTGSNDTRLTVHKTEAAKKLGVDGCLVIVPYYNKPTPEGCYAHFAEVAKVGLPLLVYHHPGRTGVRLSAEVLTKICALPSIIGIKESTGDVQMVRDLQKLSKTLIFSGDDPLTVETVRAGGVGVISVTANVVPGVWSQIVKLCHLGEFDQAQALLGRYQALCNALFLETNPHGIKYAMQVVGKCRADMRLPLVMPREETQQHIRSALEELQVYVG